MENKWAYFKIEEYRDFLQRFPIAEEVLGSQFVEEDDIVHIDSTEITEEQREELGEDAFFEILGHVHKWYVIHTYSSFEKVVKENLEQRLKSLGLSARVSEILIPTEDVMEVKGGKNRSLPSALFPDMCLSKWKLMTRCGMLSEIRRKSPAL
jgi:hypothetical protein